MNDLSHWIDRHAEFTPDKPALKCDGQEYTYAQLADSVARLAGVLQEGLGVGAGDRVAYLGLNHPLALALLFACARVGAIFMPLNWRLAPPEHRFMLDDATPCVLVAESDYVEHVNGIVTDGNGMRLVVLGGSAENWQSLDELLDEAAPCPAGVAGPSDPVLLCYTSGTTGKPKGAILNQNALFHNAINSNHMHGMTSDDIVLTCLPIFHVGGINVQTLPALHLGATVILMAKYDPEAMIDLIEREKVTLSILIPTQVSDMMTRPRWAAADLSSLRLITSGSTIVPENLVRYFFDRGLPLVQMYGSTETSPVAVYPTIESARAKPAAAGKPALHCDVRIVDENDNDVAVGESGEIIVRGPNVMVEYWKNPEATAVAMKGGWFHTGDIGHKDADSDIFVVGREKDLIISGGENVYPAELENILAECDDVAEAAVVGRPHDHWGEIVVAAVVRAGASELTAEQTIGLFEGRVANFKRPRAVVFIDQLPRNAMGKVVKEEVARLVGKHLADDNGGATKEASAK